MERTRTDVTAGMRPRRIWQLGLTLWNFGRRKPLGGFGALLALTSVSVALLAPVLAPHDPNEISGNLFRAPGKEFLLGTDNFGRDQLSRLLWGSRISIYVGIMSVSLGVTAGSLLGLVTGYWAGSAFDTILQRLVDALMGFPILILALILSVALGASVNSVVLAISLAYAPTAQRVLRAAALSVRDAQYVEAARAIGCGTPRILIFHVLPQCVAPYLVIATTMLGQAIVVESAISFVGAGPPPPTPTWGNMLSVGARHYAETAPWLVIFPGLAISLSVFGFSLLGDAVRDVLDPRLRKA